MTPSSAIASGWQDAGYERTRPGATCGCAHRRMCRVCPQLHARRSFESSKMWLRRRQPFLYLHRPWLGLVSSLSSVSLASCVVDPTTGTMSDTTPLMSGPGARGGSRDTFRPSVIERAASAARGLRVAQHAGGGTDGAAARSRPAAGGSTGSPPGPPSRGSLDTEEQIQLMELMEDLHDARTEDELAGVMAKMERHLGRHPVIRVPELKRFVLDGGVHKRSMSLKLWTPGVAKAYGRVLRVFDLPPEATFSGDEEARADEIKKNVLLDTDGLGDDGQGTAKGGGLLADDPAFELPQRRKLLKRYSSVLTCFLAFVVVLSIAKGRRFGWFFLDDVVLLLTTLLGTWLSFSAPKGRKENVLWPIQVFVVCMFASLVIGTLVSLVFLTDVKGRVDSLCVEYQQYCDQNPLGQLYTVGHVAAFMLAVGYFAIYQYGLRAANDYMQAMVMFLEQADMPGEASTGLTPVCDFAVKWGLPGMPCLRRCHRRFRCMSVVDRRVVCTCARRSFCNFEYPTQDACGWYTIVFFILVVVAVALVTTIICAANDSDTSCIYSAVLWDLIQLFMNKERKNDSMH